MVIALTGGIASGKSTVGNIIRGYGFNVVDFDNITNDLFRDADVKAQLEDAFTSNIFNTAGDIDRSRLRKIVCDNSSDFDMLDDILASRIEHELGDLVIRSQMSSPRTFIEVPLLYESCLSWMFDNTAFVYAEKKLQLRRLIERGLSVREAEAMIARQDPPQAKAIMSQHTVLNIGTMTELEETVRQLLLYIE